MKTISRIVIMFINDLKIIKILFDYVHEKSRKKSE